MVEVPTWIPGVPRWLPLAFTVTMVLASAVGLAGELRRGERGGGPALAGWMAASLLLVGGSALIVAHGLPEVFFDWYEHYVRSLVFLEHRPLETTIGPWSMAARGPLFNATCARFLEVIGRDDYAAYQVGAIVLNATVVLPLALLVRDLAGFHERRAIAFAVAVTAVMPFFFWNATFTWTKLYATAYVLAGAHLAATGLGTGRTRRAAWSLPFLGAGFLVHYLVFVYAALLGIYLIAALLKCRRSVTLLVIPAAVTLAMVLPWLVVLSARLGIEKTLASNSTLKTSAPLAWWNLRNNLVTTLVPRPLRRGAPFAGTVLEAQSYRVRTWDPAGTRVETSTGYDWTAMDTMPEALGIGFSALFILGAGLCLADLLRGRGPPRIVVLSWSVLALTGLAANILAIRWLVSGGGASLNLQPLVALAMVFVAWSLRRLPPMAAVVVAFAAFGECVWTTARLVGQQTLELPADLANLTRTTSPVVVTVLEDFRINQAAKLRYETVFLRDQLGGAAPWVAAFLAASGVALILYLLARANRRPNKDRPHRRDTFLSSLDSSGFSVIPAMQEQESDRNAIS